VERSVEANVKRRHAESCLRWRIARKSRQRYLLIAACVCVCLCVCVSVCVVSGSVGGKWKNTYIMFTHMTLCV